MRSLVSSFFRGRISTWCLTVLSLIVFFHEKQIYSPARCPTKTNSPWTRNQSPAGYVFCEHQISSFLSRVAFLRASFVRSKIHRRRRREIEESKDFCSSVESPEGGKTNKTREHFLTRALFLSLSICDKHTHTHTHKNITVNLGFDQKRGHSDGHVDDLVRRGRDHR